MMISIFKNKPAFAPAIVGEIYSTCSDLMMYNYVKCAISGDCTYLIKSGQPGGLNEAWGIIQDEYVDLSKDANQSYILKLAIEIDTLDKKLIIIQSIVDELSKYRNESLIKLLQEDLGFPFEYIDLDLDLKKTITKAKFDLINLKRLEAEYKQFVEDTRSNREVTEQDYEEQFVMLSKWMGAKYTLKNTSVSEYIALINRFNAENKQK